MNNSNTPLHIANKPKPTAGVFKTLSSFSKLNTEQQQIIAQKAINGSHTPELWLSLLQEIVVHDENNDAARSMLTKFMVASGITLFITFFIIGVFPPILFLSGLCLLILIASGIMYSHLKSSDVPNFVRLYLYPFINILQGEMLPESEITITAYMGNKESDKYFVRSIPGNNSGYPRIVTKFYNVPFLHVSALLADKSLLEIDMVDLIRSRRITKRNPRGKIKTKIKYKIKATYDIKVSFPKKNYVVSTHDANPRAMGGTSNDKMKVKFKENDKRNIFSIKKVQIFNNLAYVPEINFLLGAISEAYKKVRQNQS